MRKQILNCNFLGILAIIWLFAIHPAACTQEQSALNATDCEAGAASNFPSSQTAVSALKKSAILEKPIKNSEMVGAASTNLLLPHQEQDASEFNEDNKVDLAITGSDSALQNQEKNVNELKDHEKIEPTATDAESIMQGPDQIVGGNESNNAADINEEEDSAEVGVGSRYSFLISGISGFTAAERADIVTRRIDKVLKSANMNPEDITVRYLKDGSPAVVLGDFVLVSISRNDGILNNQTQDELAGSLAVKLKTQIKQLQPVYLRAEKLSTIRVLKEHRVLLLMLQVAVLLVAAFICGELMVLVGQPRVIGQLLAGILLGPTVLGTIAPQLSALVFPVEKAQSNLLEVVSWLGVIFLLLLSGTEVNLDLIKTHRKATTGAALAGAILPFLVGLTTGFLLPEQFLVASDHRLPFAIFLGALFSVSSVPVVTKILADMNLLRSPVGQITMSAALVQDIFGCIILALAATLVSAGGQESNVSLLKACLGGIVFVVSLYLGRRLIFRFLEFVERKDNDESTLTTIIIMLLVSAAITQYLGLHVVLGSFAVGVLIAQSPMVHEKIMHPLRMVTMAIFAPVFFAAAGLNVNLTMFSDPQLLASTALCCLIVCITKIGAGFIGSFWGGLTKRESLAVGIGTNAYGAMGLIFAIIGFSLGLLTVNTYSIIVVVALITTACAPPLLQMTIRNKAQEIIEPSNSISTMTSSQECTDAL